MIIIKNTQTFIFLNYNIIKTKKNNFEKEKFSRKKTEYNNTYMQKKRWKEYEKIRYYYYAKKITFSFFEYVYVIL